MGCDLGKETLEVMASLLQPDPQDVMQAIVTLHDIDTVSVPWLLAYTDMVNAQDLQSLRATLHIYRTL